MAQPGTLDLPGELLVRITRPSGTGVASSAGGNVALGGVVLGRPTWVVYESSGGQAGSVTRAAGSPYWTTDGIPLAPGDNRITVTAADAQGVTASDTIVVTYNPSFLFAHPLEVTPPALFVGDTQVLVARIDLWPFGDLASNAQGLQRVSAQGELVKELGLMKDDGLVASSGDEIPRDGVFTSRFSLTCSTPGPIYLRAAVPVKNVGGQTAVAGSAIARVDCLNRLDAAACSAHVATLAAARDAVHAAIDAGDASGARQAALGILQADPQVAEVAGVEEEGGLWVRFHDGVLGAVNGARGDVRGGGAGDDGGLAIASSGLVGTVDVGSRDVLALSPIEGEFNGDTEARLAANAAALVPCPAFDVKGPFPGSQASLARFRSMHENGLVVVAAHGDTYFGSLSGDFKRQLGWSHLGAQEVLWTGEPVSCAKFATATVACSSTSQCPEGSECLVTQSAVGPDVVAVSGVCFDATQVDLMSGRAILGDRTYGITPAFVTYHAGSRGYPASLVYLGACRSLHNGSLASAFLAAGAASVAGYTDTVSGTFAATIGGQFLTNVVGGFPVGEALVQGTQDPGNPRGRFQVLGAQGLSLADWRLRNPGFESGDLAGWKKEGDGRVITRLGWANPVDGRFMGIVSTGLGFSVSNGLIEQRFCLPPGATELSFWWKFYSEEFKEYCGSIYQDTFQARLVDRSGKEHQLVNVRVDDLCGVKDCVSGCGASALPLTESDVSFDQGNVFKTDWQRRTYSLAAFPVETDPVPVSLRFYTTDKGDSIYDTAVLVDAVSVR